MSACLQGQLHAGQGQHRPSKHRHSLGERERHGDATFKPTDEQMLPVEARLGQARHQLTGPMHSEAGGRVCM